MCHGLIPWRFGYICHRLIPWRFGYICHGLIPWRFGYICHRLIPWRFGYICHGLIPWRFGYICHRLIPWRSGYICHGLIPSRFGQGAQGSRSDSFQLCQDLDAPAILACIQTLVQGLKASADIFARLHLNLIRSRRDLTTSASSVVRTTALRASLRTLPASQADLFNDHV